MAWEFNSHTTREVALSLKNYFQDFQTHEPVINLDVTVAGNMPNHSCFQEIDRILVGLQNECTVDNRAINDSVEIYNI